MENAAEIYFEDENTDEALRSIYWCPYCLAMFEEECYCYSDDGDDI